MSAPDNSQSNAPLTPSQQAMVDLWEEHMRDEFELRNVEKTLETMVDHPYNNVVPTLTGGIGRDGVREFYTKWFIPQNPLDSEITPVSRTIGNDQLIDEMIFKFTHTSQMDWMLPGISPTGKRVETPVIVFVGFRDGKIAYERIYWDQASVLVQIGLLDSDTLPVVGVESARKVLDPTLPSNQLITRASQQK
jgi:carboxymethylenebutenolidase